MRILPLLLLLCTPSLASSAGLPDWIDQFESKIVKYEALPMPPPNGVVVTGNSNIVGWNSTISKDLAPLPIIARGFGGSTSEELRYYLNRIVLNYDPRAVVICEGENDYARKYTPQQIADIQADIIKKIRAKRPDTAVALIALKPSPSRMHKWTVFKETNALLESVCTKAKNCLFIDNVERSARFECNPRRHSFWMTVCT